MDERAVLEQMAPGLAGAVIDAMALVVTHTVVRGCDYATSYGMPWTRTCGKPAVGKWHEEDDEWFCAEHIDPPCEHCGDSEPWLRGILLGANGPETVEACDCEHHEGDLAAAFVVAQAVGGVVKFRQHNTALTAVLERQADESFESHMRIFGATWAELGFELRAYDGRGQDDDCVLSQTYPWIEIDGQAVNWRQYRAIAAAMEKASAA